MAENIENTVLSYQFEPLRGEEEEDSDDGWETMEEDSDVEQTLIGEERGQKEADEWCLCGNCQRMQKSLECICCKEVEETKVMVTADNLGCIVDHNSFHAVCLNKDVLWTALVNLADREGAVIPQRDNVTNRTYRYASYRQFTWWVHNRLGRHVRRVIPSCAVSRIRAEFEEDSGDYSCFSGTDNVASEIAVAMAWRRNENGVEDA